MEPLNYETPSTKARRASALLLFGIFGASWITAWFFFGWIEDEYHNAVTGHYGDGGVFVLAGRSVLPGLALVTALKLSPWRQQIGIWWAIAIGGLSALLGFVWVYIFW